MKKFLLGFFIGLPLLAVIIAVGLWFSLGSIVKTGVERVAPKATQARVSLRDVSVDLFAGRITLTGLAIGNPDGFSSPEALRFERILLRVDKSTVTANPVVIREIVVEAPVVNYERKGKSSNIETIQANIGQYVKDVTATLGGREAAGPGKPEPRYIVDSLVVRDARVALYTPLSQDSTASFTIPELRRNNLGRAEGGLTSGQLAEALLYGLIGDLGRNLTDPLARTGKSLESLLGGVLGK